MNSDTPIQNYFPALSEPELRTLLAEKGRVREVHEGDVIMEIGQHIQSIPLVMNGSVKVLREDEDGNEILLYYLGSGESCAMSLTCCLGEERSQVRAIAEEDTTLFMIPAHLMDEWMMKFRSWKNFIMATFSARFEELLHTIDLIAFRKMDERLLHYLHEKAGIQKSNLLSITHQQIAYDLNSSREAVSRLLKQLERMGKVKLSRNRIELLEK